MQSAEARQWKQYKRLNKGWEGGQNRLHIIWWLWLSGSRSLPRSLCLLFSFSLCYLPLHVFFLSPLFSHRCHIMACVLIGAAQGSRVLSGQDLGSDQQIGGPVGLGQCSSYQRHLCFSWTSRNAELIQEKSQTCRKRRLMKTNSQCRVIILSNSFIRQMLLLMCPDFDQTSYYDSECTRAKGHQRHIH